MVRLVWITLVVLILFFAVSFHDSKPGRTVTTHTTDRTCAIHPTGMVECR